MLKRSDKEILAFAAKAAGYSEKDYIYAYIPWNPIDNAGDCADLEAKLMIDTYWSDSEVECVSWDGEFNIIAKYQDFDGDKAKARREAVVVVAANIGFNME